MKLLQKISLLVLLITGSVQLSRAAFYTIEADSSQFIQNFDSIIVGDTVKWIWVEGNHTTSSNGIPPGAATWNELLDGQHTSFTYIVLFSGTYNYISVPDAPLMNGNFVALSPTGISTPLMVVSDFNIVRNPARGTIQFHFELAQQPSGFYNDGMVDVSLYNILGTKIQTLYRGTIPSADFRQRVSLPSNISDGIYLVTLKIGDAMLTRRVVIQ